jgi:hypothetical protein
LINDSSTPAATLDFIFVLHRQQHRHRLAVFVVTTTGPDLLALM